MKHFVLWFFLFACAAEPCKSYWPEQWALKYGMAPAYPVNFTSTTLKGAELDIGDIPPDAVDEHIDKIDACMLKLVPYSAEITRDAVCFNVAEAPLRDCVRIKVGDWHVGCSGDQLLTWRAPDEACTSKGLMPTKVCPCYWRSGVQDRRTIVTTPNFHLFADWYIRVFWGCLSPWGHPAVAACASIELTTR